MFSSSDSRARLRRGGIASSGRKTRISSSSRRQAPKSGKTLSKGKQKSQEFQTRFDSKRIARSFAMASRCPLATNKILRQTVGVYTRPNALYSRNKRIWLQQIDQHVLTSGQLNCIAQTRVKSTRPKAEDVRELLKTFTGIKPEEESPEAQFIATVARRSREQKANDNAVGSQDVDREEIQTLATNRPIEQVWAEYQQRIMEDKELTDQDFIRLCMAIKKELKGKIAIQRLQSVLREIHRRKKNEKTFVRACNMLMHLFIVQNDLNSAKLVLDGMMQSNYTPSETTIRSLLYGISTFGNVADVHDLYNRLNEKGICPRTAEFYRFLILTCSRLHNLQSARAYFAKALSVEGLSQDADVYQAMFLALKDHGKAEDALELYEDMKKQGIKTTTATCHVLLETLRKKGDIAACDRLFEEAVQSGVELNASHFLAMGWEPLKALEKMKELGIPCNTRSYNTFLSDYIKRNEFMGALQIFQSMRNSDVEMDTATYSMIIDTLAKDREQPVEAVYDLYSEMKENNVAPDVRVYTSLLNACAREENYERATTFFQEMQEHKVEPNVYTFNSMFTLLARKQFVGETDRENAKQLWFSMENFGVIPDVRTYNLYLSLLSKLVRSRKTDQKMWEIDGGTAYQMPEVAKQMSQLYRRMRNSKRPSCKPDFATYSILINSLVSCGQLRYAMQVYDDAKIARVKLPVATYNTMMRAMERAKQVPQIMNIWHDMKTQGVEPDNISYSVALEACEQLGLPETFEAIRAQRKKDINRLIELEKQEEARIIRAKSLRDAVIDNSMYPSEPMKQ